MRKSRKHLKKPQASKRARKLPPLPQSPQVDRERIQSESQGIQQAVSGMAPFDPNKPWKGVEILKQTKK